MSPCPRAVPFALAAAFLALPVLVPPANALGGEAQRAMVTDADLRGPLVAADLPPEHADAKLTLRLEAAAATFLVQEYRWTAGATSVQSLATHPDDRVGHVEGVVATGASRDDVAFTLLPLAEGAATLQVVAPCLGLAAATSGTATFVDRTGGGPSPPPARPAPLAGSLAAGACQGTATVRATGSFQFSLWSLDVEASGAGDAGTYPSGREQDARAPGAPCVAGCDLVKRQSYVTVENGTLEITGVPLASALLHATALRGPATKLVLDEGEPIVHAGGLTLDLRADSGRVRAVAAPVQPPANPDAVVAQGPLAWGWGYGLLAALALPAVAVGLIAVRGRRAARRLDDAEALLEQGLPHEAARLARPLLRRARQRDEAAFVLVQALCDAGVPAEARATVAQVWPADRPVAAYLRAYIEAAQGRQDAAVRELADCLAAAPDFLPEVQAQPLFRRALRSPALARWLGPHSPGYS
ncbi:MAG: hypothetical protein QOD77_107 [Thermoplasmata archaeon]|jgi:hypothetical protein|nr:hypothetical protein [Thermoplasmata archaeon]